LTHTRKFSLAFLIMALSMLGYLAAIHLADQAEILASLRELGGAQLALILALSLVNYGLRFLRWHWLITRLGHGVPPFQHLSYYLGGFAFTVTPGKAGEGIRAVYLKPHGVSYMDSLAALFMERLQDLLTIGLLSALIIYQFQDFQWLVLAALLLLALVTWTIGLPSLPANLLLLEKKISVRPLSFVLRHLAGLFDAATRLRQPSLFGTGMLLGVVAWAAEGFALYLILVWLGMDISLPVAMGIYALSLLVGAASLLPGGLGGTEVAMAALLALSGASPTIAVAATLLCRLTTLWFAVILGAGAITLLSARNLLRSKPNAEY
jgi:glycosyltransferase 2 family protein